jgi:predicted transcriptional regulator
MMHIVSTATTQTVERLILRVIGHNRVVPLTEIESKLVSFVDYHTLRQVLNDMVERGMVLRAADRKHFWFKGFRTNGERSARQPWTGEVL